MRPLPTVVFLIVLLVVSAGAANAVITPTSQSRTISSTAFAADATGSGSDSDSNAAVDFGPFNDGVFATVLLPGAIGSGTATQLSEINPGSIHAEGSHSANGEGWEEEGYGDGSGNSHFEVTFDLGQTSDYELSGWIEEFDSGSTHLSLTGPSGTVHYLYPPSNETLFISEQGNLAAGSYTLVVHTAGSAFGDYYFYDYASGAYDIDLTFGAATDAPDRTVAASAPIVAPNPFRTTTRISYQIPVGQRFEATVHDVQGRIVRRLLSNAAPGGPTEWDGRDDAGRPVPAGVYFVQVTTLRGPVRTKITRVR
jgi:hypothetical protein